MREVSIYCAVNKSLSRWDVDPFDPDLGGNFFQTTPYQLASPVQLSIQIFVIYFCMQELLTIKTNAENLFWISKSGLVG